MIQVGSYVRVKPPFDEVFPGERVVTGQSETGAWQINEVDFAEEHLEEVI